MIQDFADWFVYGLFGLSADTPLGVAVNFFFYDTIKILILLFYGAQNETYIEGWEKKTSKLLIYKRLCKI